MRIPRPSSLLACITFVPCILLSLSSEDGGNGVDDEILQQINVMMEWLIDEDGSMDPRIEIRRSNSKDPNSRIGIFVKEAIQTDELLIEIPGEIKIQLDDIIPKKESDDDGSNDDDSSSDEDKEKASKDYQDHICKLAWALRDEYDDEEDSEFYPYITYLQLQPFPRVPAMFSTAAQHLLLQTQREIAVRTLDGFEESNDIVMWPWRLYEEDCIQDDDDEGNSLNPYFITMAVQMGLEHAFVPFYDLVAHHSDNAKINIFTKPSIFSDEDFGIYASRDLEPGEELFRSYRECHDCPTGRADYLGTPEILRDYGIVEPYPQTFHFDDDIVVIVDEMGEGKYAARCLNDKCPSKPMVEARIKDLTGVIAYMMQTSEPIMENSEYDTINEYHKALVVAMTTVLPHCADDPTAVNPPHHPPIRSLEEPATSTNEKDSDKKDEL
ncbi:unnamed protein product [Cylindrotheca closterium]|uniref:SET domain-containing protein n=1 Tax=Cylindrotheca closterium TaxID=2856 RepID=A0AAD2FPI7_9STRA|nr:unnamed protein product [Cylindrotheca closterium]